MSDETAIIKHDPKTQITRSDDGAIVPADIDQVWRVATLIHGSGMAPKGLDSKEAISVAIMHGLEIGLKPMAAVQSIAVINGRPSIWGDAALGLVRASGKLEYIVEEQIAHGGDVDGYRCRVKRKGDPAEIEHVFTLRMADRAGLRAKSGPWKQYPERMCQMRARSFALRDAFPDVLRGLLLREEAQDLPQEVDVTPTTNPLASRVVATLAEPQDKQVHDDKRVAPADARVDDDTGRDEKETPEPAVEKTAAQLKDDIKRWYKPINDGDYGRDDFKSVLANIGRPVDITKMSDLKNCDDVDKLRGLAEAFAIYCGEADL